MTLADPAIALDTHHDPPMTNPEKKARKTRRKAAAGEGTVVAPQILPEQAVALVAVAVQAFANAEAELQAIEAKHRGVVYAVDTSKGLAEARAARYEIRLLRYAVQNRLAETITAMENTKGSLKAVAGGLIARLSPLEDPIDKQIKVREEALEQERLRKERELAERNARIDAILAKVRGLAFSAIGAPLATLEATVAELDALADITPEVFGTRLAEGEDARAQARSALVLLVERERVLEAERAEQRRQSEERAAKRKEAEDAAAKERAAIAAAREQLERDKRTLAAERDRTNPPAPAPAPAAEAAPARVDLDKLADVAADEQRTRDAEPPPAPRRIYDPELVQKYADDLMIAARNVFIELTHTDEQFNNLPQPLHSRVRAMGLVLQKMLGSEEV